MRSVICWFLCVVLLSGCMALAPSDLWNSDMGQGDEHPKHIEKREQRESPEPSQQPEQPEQEQEEIEAPT